MQWKIIKLCLLYQSLILFTGVDKTEVYNIIMHNNKICNFTLFCEMRGYLKKYDTLNQLHKNFLVAVVRGDDAIQTKRFIDQMIKGGIKNIEITFTVPSAGKVIEQVKKEYIDQIVIGAGTVLDCTTARLAIEKGAEYIVSPHLDTEISKLCNIYSVPYLPGCNNTTEIVEALKFGSDIVKLFPGDQLGTKFIKDIKGPLPNVELMPSGGVNLENMSDWVSQGAFAIGIGNDLIKGFTGENFEIVEKKSRSYVNAFKKMEMECQA